MDLVFNTQNRTYRCQLSRNKKAETALKKWPSMNFLKCERVFWTSRAQTQTHTYTNKERDKGNTFFGRPPVEYLIGCNIIHIFSVCISMFLQAAYKDWANCPSSSFHKLRPFEFSCRNPQWNLNFTLYWLAIFVACVVCAAIQQPCFIFWVWRKTSITHPHSFPSHVTRSPLCEDSLAPFNTNVLVCSTFDLFFF